MSNTEEFVKIRLVTPLQAYKLILFDVGPCKETPFKTKRGEIYTPFKTEKTENHTLSGRTCPFSPNKGVPPSPRGVLTISRYQQITIHSERKISIFTSRTIIIINHSFSRLLSVFYKVTDHAFILHVTSLA